MLPLLLAEEASFGFKALLWLACVGFSLLIILEGLRMIATRTAYTRRTLLTLFRRIEYRGAIPVFQGYVYVTVGTGILCGSIALLFFGPFLANPTTEAKSDTFKEFRDSFRGPASFSDALTDPSSFRPQEQPGDLAGVNPTAPRREEPVLSARERAILNGEIPPGGTAIDGMPGTMSGESGMRGPSDGTMGPPDGMNWPRGGMPMGPPMPASGQGGPMNSGGKADGAPGAGRLAEDGGERDSATDTSPESTVAEDEDSSDSTPESTANSEQPSEVADADGDEWSNVHRTQLLGGPGGVEFEFVDVEERAPLGIRCSITTWGGGKAIESLEPVYSRGKDDPDIVLARQGYVLAGLEVDAARFVRGIRPIFMRQVRGKLDPSKTYRGEWLGTHSDDRVKQLGGDGTTLLGIHGHKSLVLDAVGLILRRSR